MFPSFVIAILNTYIIFGKYVEYHVSKFRKYFKKKNKKKNYNASVY